jgi:hypothetical protein
LALHGDRSAVRFDQGLHDRQAQSKAPVLTVLIPLSIGREQLGGIFGIDADSRVAHRDPGAVSSCAPTRQSTRLRVIDGVSHEVLENLGQSLRIGVDRHGPRRQLAFERQAFAFDLLPHAVEKRRHPVRQVQRLTRQANLPVLDPRDVEEVVDDFVMCAACRRRISSARVERVSVAWINERLLRMADSGLRSS